MRSIGAALLGALALVTGCQPDTQRFEFESPHMGTLFRIVLYASDSLAARQAVDAAFARVDSLNAHLSDYLPESELNRLSDTAGQDTFVSVSNDLWTVLLRAQEVSQATDGAFDVTVGQLTRMWRRAIRRNTLPDSVELAVARATVGYQSMDLDQRTQCVRLQLAGTRLDLGGIAKGYAADAALSVLRAHGFDRALVDAGGDIVAGAPPPGRDGWRVDLPGGRSTELANGAVAVSGDEFKYVEAGGVRYSHILDPQTGYGTTHVPVVEYFAPDAMTADAHASALLVLRARIISHPTDDTPKDNHENSP